MLAGLTNHIELKRLAGNRKEWRKYKRILKPTCVEKKIMSACMVPTVNLKIP